MDTGKVGPFYAVMYNDGKDGKENWQPCCLKGDDYMAMFHEYEDALKVYKRIKDEHRPYFMIAQISMDWIKASK